MLRVSRRIIAGLVVGSFTTVYAATDCTKVTEIPVSECQSLLELYNNTDGENWKNKTGWNETNTPCRWFGITCSGGSVRKIELFDDGSKSHEGNNLNGQIPNLILPNLSSLNLSYNQLSGEIPNFSNLPNLLILHLHYNKLTGSLPDFSNVPKLTEFWVYSNQLTGNIPNFSNLPNLQKLSLSYNKLNGEIPNFSNLRKLQELYLAGNQLVGNIPDFNLPNLIAINFYLNKLSGNIPNFSSVQNLQQIDFGQNLLGGTIPNFTNLQKLQYLDIHQNPLIGNIPNFSNLPSLQYLDLSGTLLTGTVPNFNKLSNLQMLSLSDNHLTGTIPNFDLPKLVALRLDNNQLGGIIPNFTSFNLANLQYTWFSDNCGLTAFDSAQEIVLNQKDSRWKTQNPNCSNIAPTCPLVSISQALEIQIPHLNYNNMTLSANLRYAPRDNKALFEVVNYSVNSESCASANLSPDFKLHIPTATFGDIKLWADFQLHSIENDKITFELVKYGNA